MRTIDFTVTRPIGSLLIHALNNVGKSHILGSALALEKQAGPCLYAGMLGEPNATLGQFELKDVEAVEFETVEDIVTFTAKAKPYQCIAIDSLQRLSEMASNKVTGGAYVVGAKEDHGRDWAKLKYEFFKPLMLLAAKCTLLLAVCPSNLHENAITKQQRVVPDVPGVSEKVVGRFNFTGYLEAVVLGPTQISRQLHFQPRPDVVTRWNAPGKVEKPLPLPVGLSTWEIIKARIELGLKG